MLVFGFGLGLTCGPTLKGYDTQPGILMENRIGIRMTIPIGSKTGGNISYRSLSTP